MAFQAFAPGARTDAEQSRSGGGEPRERLVAPSLADKVAFLGSPAAWPGGTKAVERLETHMSWLFFGDGTVLKLKKPVRFDYLDFSTLARREAACRAEYAVNQRLAPGVYRAATPLVLRDGRLAVGGAGEVVDWLVVMRRLDLSRTLEAKVVAGTLTGAEVEALSARLARFYRHTGRARVTPAEQMVRWRKAVLDDARVLLRPELGLPAGRVRRILAVQRRFLRLRPDLIAGRVRRRRILDAHGDLRPEHVWIGPPVRIIDRLEFSPALRAVDPLDELCFLQVELERLGGGAVADRVLQRVMWRLGEPVPEALRLFYRIARATMRARLSIAHLLEPHPRLPAKWPGLARAYLDMAAADAEALDRLPGPGRPAA